MMLPEVQHARDYNRGLAWPVRMAHLLWAVGLWITRPIRLWTAHPSRRPWIRPLLWGVVLAAVIGRWDGMIARFLAVQLPAGREVSPILLVAALLACIVSAAMVASLSDPRGREIVIRWITGFITLFLAARLLPMVVGRPRPSFGDPAYFISPFGQYPLGAAVGIRHAWEFWIPGISRLWSMPSRETAYAFFAAWTIAAIRPPWRAVCFAGAVLAGLLAIASNQHYASDAVIGATLGIAAARVVMRAPGSQERGST